MQKTFTSIPTKQGNETNVIKKMLDANAEKLEPNFHEGRISFRCSFTLRRNKGALPSRSGANKNETFAGTCSGVRPFVC